jgi:hypothetical protein
MTTTAVIVGGLHDGMRLPIGLTDPPMVVEVALPKPISALLDPDWTAPSFRKVACPLLLDETGFPSRADDGAYRYAWPHDA